MTEQELAEAIRERYFRKGDKYYRDMGEEIVRLMKHAAETARIDTTLSTQGRVHKTIFVPGLPE